MKAVEGWPRLSVAAAVLPAIRRELLAHARTPRVLPGPPIDVCPIVEDGLFGYELAPHPSAVPCLIVGCTADGVPRLRRTSFDPSSETGLRLATLHGRRVTTARPRARGAPRSAEVLYSDWSTAVTHAWAALDPALDFPGPQWDASMAACKSLENALAVASLHLAEWDPAIDFCGLLHQAEYGLPLHCATGESGALTMRRTELWHLSWHSPRTIIDLEFSYLGQPCGAPASLPCGAAR